MVMIPTLVDAIEVSPHYWWVRVRCPCCGGNTKLTVLDAGWRAGLHKRGSTPNCGVCGRQMTSGGSMEAKDLHCPNRCGAEDHR